MKHTPMYRILYHSKPELLKEAFKPERIKLLAKPEMVKALIKMDRAILKLLHREEGLSTHPSHSTPPVHSIHTTHHVPHTNHLQSSHSHLTQ